MLCHAVKHGQIPGNMTAAFDRRKMSQTAVGVDATLGATAYCHIGGAVADQMHLLPR